jgi:hypothetical protein
MLNQLYETSGRSPPIVSWGSKGTIKQLFRKRS